MSEKMKCDELEEEYLWTNNVKTPSTRMVRAYNADEVDKAIEELKARIQLDDDEMDIYIAKLESRIPAWRKFPDEKPEDEGEYLVMARYPDDDEPHIEICFYDRDGEDFGHYERRYAGSGNYFGGLDGEEWVTHNVSFWMPLPSAPKEAK